jgi:hypothetical protein
MPATKLYGAHLDQQELSEDTKEKVRDVGAWVLSPAVEAKFVTKSTGQQTLAVDPEDEVVKPLLDKLGFAAAVRAHVLQAWKNHFLMKFKSAPAGCLIYRISGTSVLKNSTGPTSILPINISEEKKATAGGMLLKVGHITYTTSPVIIEPEVDILVIFPQQSSRSEW